MLYKVETPILVAQNRKGKKEKHFFYSLTEFKNWEVKHNLLDYEIKYKKGLAALVDDEYDDIINKPKLTLIKKDETADQYLDVWFGKNSSLRKDELLK